jgi:four helix bundle protein
MATILIIDDDPITLGLLRTRLEKTGYKVKHATDGEEGQLKAEKERPDLVILDVRMPRVDGWQVCRALKSNPATSHCPIIMLTGCSQDAQELYGLQCGADEYITKPWDAKRLMQVLSALLKRSASSLDAKSDLSQKRTRDLVQRIVRLVGKFPKSQHTELMAGQLLRLATSLMANYQAAILDKFTPDYRLKMARVDQEAGELLYWLGLLRDSRTCEDPDLPLVMTEANALRDVFSNASQIDSQK